MKTTILKVECGAKTKTGKFAELPKGTEVQASPQEIMDPINVPGVNDVSLLARCPRAKNPAPYTIDASDLRLAIGRYF